MFKIRPEQKFWKGTGLIRLYLSVQVDAAGIVPDVENPLPRVAAVRRSVHTASVSPLPEKTGHRHEDAIRMGLRAKDLMSIDLCHW